MLINLTVKGEFTLHYLWIKPQQRVSRQESARGARSAPTWLYTIIQLTLHQTGHVLS